MLEINTSNVIDFILTNPLAIPTYVNDATVTVTIYDSLGVELGGVAWPQALTYVTASEGLYRETFAPFTELIENEIYTITIKAVGADTLEKECSTKGRAIKGGCC